MTRSALFLSFLLIFSSLGNKVTEEEREYYVLLDREVLEDFPELLRRISLDHRYDSELRAYLSPQAKSFFDESDIPYTLLPHPGKLLTPQQLTSAGPIPSWDRYPTYQEYLDIMQHLADSFPTLCTRIDFGNSVEGRELLFLKISDNVTIDEAEPEFMYTSTMHGDETAGYVFSLRLAWELLHNYGQDALATRLVDSLEIYINPLFNPDGTYAVTDTSVWGATRANANGYDLNRNFPDPRVGNFPGGTRQVETQHMMDFMEGRNFHLSANMHGGAEVMNYPWDTWQRRHADDEWFIYICRQYADTAQAHSPGGYMTDLNNGITNGWDWYQIAGGRQDYAIYYLGGRELTFELSQTKVLPAIQLDSYYGYNRSAMLNYMEQALFGLQGFVSDSLTGLPLQATIEIPGYDLDQSEVLSDSIFGFYARFLDSGYYEIEFSADGYIPKTISNIRIDRLKRTDLDVQLVQGITGSQKLLAEEINLWPNPARDFINLEMQMAPNEAASITIFNQSGESVIKFENRSQKLSMDVSHLSSGIYFLRIDYAKESEIRKILILD